MNHQPRPSFLEDNISKIPALQLLQNLGWRYLSPAEALALRGGKRADVLLETVLSERLRALNRIRFKGGAYEFSEPNIASAVQSLRDVPFDGLVRTSEKIYELLVLGRSLQQTIDGDTKSFQLNYIDWNPATWLTNNVFHVTEEFTVERSGSHETRIPDLVLFVNGIPLVVIECKRPDSKDPLPAAISQHLRNQRDIEIPKLFLYSQLLLGISKNEAMYGTTGTQAKFWAVWREEVDTPLAPIVNRRLAADQKQRLLGNRDASVRAWYDELETQPRAVTVQDRTLYSLCRPERLLDITHNFVLFDAADKKVARYQQYFAVGNIIERIRQRDADGRRLGGVVWHTQGSGKSLTMVLLAKAIAREGLPNHKIVLVTDRVDLDGQINTTFSHCDMQPHKARNGRDLAAQLSGPHSCVLTTVIDKFENAVVREGLRNESDNIFVLVDEGHRGQFGLMHGRMRKALPNSCFIGFTGTPVKTKDKSTIATFGGLIQPTYSVRRAVEDKAVVPLLYEGRDVVQRVDRQSIDRWFDIVTANLSGEQKADLKKKFATSDRLNTSEQKVREIALDISLHYRDNWQGTPYKAQLVTTNKTTALRYKTFLDEFGMVNSEVLISGPDDREGYESVDEEDLPDVQRFWKRMMTKHGSEEQYNKNLIEGFKNGDELEIIIVVDKLLTGFDAKRNTVLYLTRNLKEHTLLQAIARVNRLCDGKDYGYIIDYRGVLANMRDALDIYGKMGEYDRADLESTFTHIREEIDKLPRRHTELRNVFRTVSNQQDVEQYERALADERVRERFYEALRDFSRSLSVAFSSTQFIEQTPDAKVETYRRDLAFFMRLRTSAARRYAEAVDFREYEAKIQKLIDTHVATSGIEKVTALVNIFDKDAFGAEVALIEGTASKADTIAHRTKRTILERMEEDPAFYRKFSELLEAAIRAFREGRLTDSEYLAKVVELADAVRTRHEEDLPEAVRQRDGPRAFYGIIRETLAAPTVDAAVEQRIAEAAVSIDEAILSERIVNWTNNTDVQNRMRNGIEDVLFDLKAEAGRTLSLKEVDALLERCLDIAQRRYAE